MMVINLMRINHNCTCLIVNLLVIIRDVLDLQNIFLEKMPIVKCILFHEIFITKYIRNQSNKFNYQSSSLSPNSSPNDPGVTIVSVYGCSQPICCRY